MCSIFKTVELSSLKQTQDPTWDSVNLTIWAATELSVGILIASLPPLRKVFDSLFRRILPSTGSKTRVSIPLYNVSKHHSKPAGRSMEDDDSEKDILYGKEIYGGITKTVQNEVMSTHDSIQPPKEVHHAYGKMEV